MGKKWLYVFIVLATIVGFIPVAPVLATGQSFFPLDEVNVTPTYTGTYSATWKDVDVSAHVPVGTTGVIVHAVGHGTFALRMNGSTDDRAPWIGYYNAGPATYDDVHTWAMVGVDANRIFESKGRTSDNVTLFLCGYTTSSGVNFFTNGYNKSTASTAGWVDVDCSSEAPGAIGLIFEVYNSEYDAMTSNFVERDFGIRKNGSADARTNHVSSHNCHTVIIGCDTSQLVEQYIEDTDTDIYLVGYVTSGAVFNTNAVDVSIGAAAWTNLTALAAGMMGFYEITNGTTRYEYGLRMDGNPATLRTHVRGRAWGAVEAVSQIVEGYVENVAVDFFEVGYATVADPPVIITRPATNVAMTAAQLNSSLTSDGGQACDVRFGYDTVTHAANFAAYTWITPWVENTYVAGNTPWVGITGITAGTGYFFNVQVRNDGGTSTGTEASFTTGAALYPPSELQLHPQPTEIGIAWTIGVGSTHTLVRAKQDSYPTGTADGEQVYFSTGSSTLYSDLEPGETWFFKVWGYATGVGYSTDNITAVVTTLASYAPRDPIPEPNEPSGWSTGGDESGMTNFPGYQIINNVADQIDMDRGNIWLGCAFLFSTVLGLLVWRLSHSMFMAGAAVVVGGVWGWVSGLIPLVFMFMFILIAVAIIFTRERA